MTIRQDIDTEALNAQLEEMRQEHRDLDDAIDALTDAGAFNQMQVQRMKKRKLVLKDQIRRL